MLQPQRCTLDYIAVPDFPTGSARSDYKRLTSGPVRVHLSLGDALTAAMAHNAASATLKRKHHDPINPARTKRPSLARHPRAHTPALQDHAPVPLHIAPVSPALPYAALLVALRNLWPTGYQPVLPASAVVAFPRVLPPPTRRSPSPDVPPPCTARARGKQKSRETVSRTPSISTRSSPAPYPASVRASPTLSHSNLFSEPDLEHLTALEDMDGCDPASGSPLSAHPATSFATDDPAAFLDTTIFHSGFDYSWAPDEDPLMGSPDDPQTAPWDGTGTIDPSLLCAAAPHSPTPSRSASPPFCPDEDAQDEGPSHPPSRETSDRRVSRPPARLDMVHMGELDLSDYARSNGSDSDDDYVAPDVKPAPSPPPPKPPARPSKSVTPSVDSAPDLTFCHHCRRTTAHDKMRCTLQRPTGEPCGKRYCTVCIAKRYPAIVFEAYYRTFECPACLGTCNCSVCSRKRGEVYYGERTGGLPKAATATQARTSPVDPARAKTYWATIYGLSGKKVGTAFVGDDGHDDVVIARPAEPAPARSRTARVFIGQVPEHWRFKRSARVRDLDPLPERERTATARAYIGKKPRARARLPHARPETVSSPFSSGSLTPLPSDDGRDGADGLEGTPVSLGEVDVEYAIRSALAQVSLGECA